MISNGTFHCVDGKQLCEKQYSDYKETQAYGHGWTNGRKEMMKWLWDTCEHTSKKQRWECAACWEQLRKELGFNISFWASFKERG